MDKINWANYNHEDFTIFCNALLTFEFGKKYQPFSASGKDGGIDGLFSGSYLDLQGNWRFQYKFRQGSRIENYRGLKSKVKSELSDLNDENYYVLLTNIELLPQEFSDLKQTFDEELNHLKKKCTCLIWDGAKLYNLYLQHPLLRLWLQDGFNTAQLQDYRNVFKLNLEKNDFSPGSLNNLFVARDVDLQSLSQFLNGDQPMLIITGEAGIGKTRLVLEFFKTKIDSLDDWSALVLLNRNIDFDKLNRSLLGGRNYIVFIDDAHNYQPEVISDIRSLCIGAKNKIKLVLTARNLDAFKSLTLLKEYDKASLPAIKLGPLTRADTERLFLSYINSGYYFNLISNLIEISYGKPILIVAILNAIQKGLSIPMIRKNDFVKEYVGNYFERYYNLVTEKTGWSLIKIKHFLQQIVLIEPFNYNDNEVVKKLADLHKVDTNEASLALKLLVENNFVDGRYEQCIKPDYYSDILLSQINREEVANYIGDFVQFLDNIIINLSSVDEVGDPNGKFLEEILNVYSLLIKDTSQIEIVNRVLTTVNNIVGFKPDVAKNTILIYLEALSNEQHIIYKDYKENYVNHNLFNYSTLTKIVQMLSFLATLPEYYDFSFRKVLRLYNLTYENKIANVYAFSRKDVIEEFNFLRQQFFLKEFNNRLNTFTSKELSFGLVVLKSWLNLEFTITDISATDQMSLNITTYYLPSSRAVKKLRRNITDTLTILYTLENEDTFKIEVLKCLLDIPRSILSTQRNSNPYHNNDEIKIVLNFLEKNAHEFNLLEKNEIKEKLFWFQQWGIAIEFLPFIKAVDAKLKPRNLTEKLSQLFSRSEIGIMQRHDKEETIRKNCDDLIIEYDIEEIVESIIQYLMPQQYSSYYFNLFLDRLIEKYPTYAKKLYYKMYETSPSIFNLYAGSILSGAYYIFKDHDFYWSEIKALQKLNSSDVDNILLSIYGRRVPGFTDICENDIDVILNVFNKKNNDNNYNLASGLQSLIAAGYTQSYEVCIDFLKRARQKEAEMFFIWLSDNKTANPSLITNLVLNHTHRFNLTYELEKCVNLALCFIGIRPVFDYFTQRYEYKKNIVVSQKTLIGYDFVPHGEHSHLFDNCKDYKIEMFKMALEWYLTLDGKGGHLFYAKNMLEYLRPSNAITLEIMPWYLYHIRSNKEMGIGVDRIIDTLTIFHIKDDHLLDIVIEAYTIANDISESNTDLYQSIRQECYFAITISGVKSGIAGQPFQVDIDLQNLLRLKISNLPEYMPATKFLKDVLKTVDADIDRSSDRTNLTW
ncbi:hypothetical protein [Parasediminibacterium sp. JCM 36343]|uniref:hypothetical protein n=1 Tax=Parasediminibacterium sp. JCM 36343 TaxID=3374279 RepID=UPI003979F5F0